MLGKPTTTLLEDAIDVPIWLDTDASMPLAERSRRDREIALGLGRDDDVAAVRGWWRQIDAHRDDLPGRRLKLARGWIRLALTLLGLAGGLGVALAALRYDGTFPVNVVWLLWLLVVPQVVLLVFNLCLIPGRLPVLSGVQDALSAFNPGALAARIYRQLTGQTHARVFDWATARTSAARRFGKWQMLYWSQLTAVAFNAAVIGTAAVLIAFTDLAFGWSTTLDVDSETAATIFRTLALPWAGLFPDAVPPDSLIEQSRFFRLEGDTALPDSRVLTAWWSFTVLAVITYGLLPRLVLLAATGWRLRAATRNLLLADSQVTALLDRMRAPALETGRPSAAARPQRRPAKAANRVLHDALKGSANAVVWNQCVPIPDAPALVGANLGLAVETMLDAGGRSLDDEQAMLEQLAGTSKTVVVLVPAWEPPLLEFGDFLGTLRSAIGQSASIIVLPVGETDGPIPKVELDNWRHAIGRTGDARAYVETGDA